MNDRLRELGAFLASREDDLWELQNAALQLTVAGVDRQLIAVVTDRLSRLRNELEERGYGALVEALDGALADLRSSSPRGQQLEQLFALVEALGAASRGASSAFLAALVSGGGAGSEGSERSAEPPAEDGGPELGPSEGAADESAADEANASLEDSFDDVDPEEIEEFCAESREHIQAIELNLVELEQTGDPECIAEVFRAAHSIKGGAQYLGLEATATVSHRMETLLDRVRSGQLEVSSGLMAVLLKGLDTLAALTRAAELQETASVDVDGVVGAMDAALDGELPNVPAAAELAASASAAAPPEQEEADAAVVEPIPAPEPAPVADEPAAMPDLTSSTEGASSDPQPPADDDSEVQLFADDYAANMSAVREILEAPEGAVRDAETAAILTRSLHTIRGIAGFVGLGPMEELADSLETLTSRVFRSRQELPEELRAPVTAALDELDRIFECFINGREIDVDVSSTIEEILTLSQREGEHLGLSHSVRAASVAAMAASDHPLAERFAEILDALDVADAAPLRAAVEELLDSTSLHGYEEISAQTDTLLSGLDGLDREQVVAALDRIAAMVPQELDGVPCGDQVVAHENFEELLLGVPGIGPKKKDAILAAGLDSCHGVRAVGMEGLIAVRGINVDQARMILSRCAEATAATPAAGDRLADELARLVREDDYDRELVRIYFETTSARVSELADQLKLEDWDLMAETLRDLVAAAAYMGYDPLHTAFEGLVSMLAEEPREAAALKREISSLGRTLGQLSELVAEDVEQEAAMTDESEAVELERIFVESAATHLDALVREVSGFFAAMTADLLAAIQHHLSCLEAAATNIGRDDASQSAEALRQRFESLWMHPEELAEEKARAMLEEITALHGLCGIEAPEIELGELGGPPPKPLESPAEDLSPGDDGTAEDFLADALRDAFSGPDEVQAVVPPELVERAAVVPPPPAEEASTEQPPAEERTPAEPQELAGWDGSQGLEASDHLEELGGIGGDGGGDDGGGPPEPPGDDQRALVEHQTTLRVDTEKIDDLMNMAAELVVNRSSLMVLGATMRDVVTRVIDSGVVSRGEASELRSLVNRFDEETNDLGRVSNQLQEGVMRMRMVPVKVLFGRVPRLVRDLALRSKRQVRVGFSGEDTELDKTVIEQLSDPLVHLIRNAIGHGIEPAAQRLAAGKAPEGQLSIHARHEGNLVILEVEDDGRGIDREAIRGRLVSSGAMPAAEVSRLNDRDLLSAVFLPGFSTAAEISDVSGRGVGLDVVKQNIESLGGQVEVFSEPGQWCRFVIRIPLTMAIMQALLVKVEQEVYSIPVSSVIQTVKLGPQDISTVENQEVITVRDQVIPLIRIGEVFTYTYHAETDQLAPARSGNGNGEEQNEDTYVVVVQGEGTEIGIVVDTVVGGQDIVIKSLEDEQVDARGIAGGAILGDGSVTLILDVGEVQKMSVDSEHFQRRRMSETLHRFERYLMENGDDFGSRPS